MSDDYNLREVQVFTEQVREAAPVYILEPHHQRKLAQIPRSVPMQTIFAEEVKPAKTQYRNATCACGSGKKFKRCCR